MANNRKQYYGIKYPFTANNLDGFFLDLNEEVKDKVASEILHVILTPKRSRLRNPEFGTDLIKYVFEPNDEITWDKVESEATEAVSKYVANTKLNSINVVAGEQNPRAVYLDLRYSVIKGNTEENNRMVVKL